MSKIVSVDSVQETPESPVMGKVSNPDDFKNAQKYSHEHTEVVTRDALMNGAAGAKVAGFNLTLTAGLSLTIATGAAYSLLGKMYDADPAPAAVTLAAAHATLPRIDLIYLLLEDDAPALIEFRPYQRLRTEAELAAGTPPYLPEELNQPQEFHTRATVQVRVGTPNASPVAPVANANEIALFQVRVNATATTLVLGNVTDVRPQFTSLAALKAIIDTYGNVVTRNTGVAAGNVPVLDSSGLLNTAVIPPLAITDVFVVNSQVAMLALNAQVGDVAVRTDAHGSPSVARNYILKTSPATVLGNWQELAASDAVLSFNTRTGAVVLLSADVTAALGFTPVNKAGDQMTGPLGMNAPATKGAIHSAVGGAEAAAILSPSTTKVGLYGSSYDVAGGVGVQGEADAIFQSVARGVVGHARIGANSAVGYGGYFEATYGNTPTGVTGYGIYATATTNGTNWAGWFQGNVTITGSLTKGSGTFLIDHPLDPENKDLYHGFIEAPRYDLIYRGRVQLKNGRAEVDIDLASNMSPGTFAALTQNVQFGQPCNEDSFNRVMVKKGSLEGGRFTIVCENAESSDWVSWLVIAERNDVFIRHSEGTDSEGHLLVEVMKVEADPAALEARVEHHVSEEEKPDETRHEIVPELIGKRGFLRHAEAHKTKLPKRKVTVKYAKRAKDKKK